MGFADQLLQKANGAEKAFTAEISPPINYQGIVKIDEIAAALKDLDLRAIAITNNTGGSFKLNPLAVVASVRRVLPSIPIIVHLTARDEGSVRTVYSHLDEMARLGVSDALVIRGDRSPQNSHQTDSYKFSTVELIRLMNDYKTERAYNLDVLIAGHPEYPLDKLDRHLGYQVAKIEAGARAMIANIVTEPERYTAYVAEARARGIDVPVMPSVIPLTTERRCEFLRTRLHIQVPSKCVEALAHLDRDAATRKGIALTSEIASRLLAAGAPGINFNIIFPQDVDSVKSVLREIRGYSTIWEKYQIEDPEEIDYFDCLRGGYF
ncbi:MAG: methylenetetrahydrofolate reductase [Acidobacteria bacterium]|nr:methylenetetrahydrofolate reductase [Acidobacteriota bacterium]